MVEKYANIISSRMELYVIKIYNICIYIIYIYVSISTIYLYL